MASYRDAIKTALKNADIEIDGTRPWDIQVHNDNLFKRVAQEGTLGAGEAYMDGWWDCDQMDVMFYKAISGNLTNQFSASKLPALIIRAMQAAFNLQNRARSFDVAKKHYNFGNDFFEAMLGPTMNYSCAYWEEADDLDSAQKAKMDMICRKLQLGPGMKVLDIGCGWGALGKYMTENYGARVTGISVASEQIAYAKKTCPDATWITDDYRVLNDKFDRIVSVGMFEHVGYKNYRPFMRKARELLKPDGLFLLHTIGANQQRMGTDPWINRYIFPNGMLPSQFNLAKAAADYFIMEDWHNFGADYDRTLMSWHERLEKGIKNRQIVIPETAHRMFRYYLLSCAGAFRARDIQLWQIVLSPSGVKNGYRSIR